MCFAQDRLALQAGLKTEDQHEITAGLNDRSSLTGDRRPEIEKS